MKPQNIKELKFLVKISQFEFFVITEKKNSVFKLFLSLNISDFTFTLFQILLYVKIATPLEKVTPLFLTNPPLKVEVLLRPPFLMKIW